VNDSITEIASIYSKLSLMELLAEENLLERMLHRKGADPLRKKLQKVLRLEIEKRLL
jgi:hypothetical protein